jgi:aminoglycoside N3'-acetyltransferase
VNSFAAIGPKAEEILADHDASALTYLPMQKIIDLDGKMLVSGCVASSPGFTTVHYAQEVLGLSRRSLVRNKVRVYYRTDAGVRLFRKASIGGCSDGFSSFYSHYVAQEKLVTGLFGSAYSILIRARDAYALELELLRKNPRVALCANPLCLSCRATWLYNKRDMPGYWVRAAIAHTIGALRSWRQKRGIGQTEEP